MKADNVLTKELRNKLKTLVANELDTLPTHLDKMDEKERIEVLIKLLPYVLPKVQNVNCSFGEPFTFD
jgi:hypothetical protein